MAAGVREMVYLPLVNHRLVRTALRDSTSVRRGAATRMEMLEDGAYNADSYAQDFRVAWRGTRRELA